MNVKKIAACINVAFIISIFVSCQKEPSADTDNNLKALPLQVLFPADNISSPEKILLGKMLFWDPVLSGNKDVACATCHHPDFGYADNLDLPVGTNGIGLGPKRCFAPQNTIPFTKRNSPTVLNTAFNGIDISGIYNPATAPMFYDLRAKSLEEQSLKPIGSLEEMRGNIFSAETATDSVVNRLKNIPAYEVMFKNAFGENSINAQNIAKAIASFERTLITTNTPFDNFMRGDDDALSKKQKTGMTIFIDAGCNRCHNGPMLSDFKTHVLGVEDNSKLTASDDGENGTYAFRTPTLRNLKYTAPYMHSGTINTLEDVVKFYNKTGRRESQNPHVSSASLARELPGPIKPEDISSLIDFLNSLNAETFDKSAPATVPSGLKVGGNI